jgi:hypothetical protein
VVTPETDPFPFARTVLAIRAERAGDQANRGGARRSRIRPLRFLSITRGTRALLRKR